VVKGFKVAHGIRLTAYSSEYYNIIVMRITILAFAVVASITSCNPKSTKTNEQKNQPYNVLFIAIDDLNDWTGFA
jgi:hypothetical protein